MIFIALVFFAELQYAKHTPITDAPSKESAIKP